MYGNCFHMIFPTIFQRSVLLGFTNNCEILLPLSEGLFLQGVGARFCIGFGASEL